MLILPFLCLTAFVVALRNSESLRSFVLGSSSETSVAESNALDQKEPSGTADEVAKDPLLIHVSSNMQLSTGVQFATIKVSDWSDDRLIPAKLELDPGRHYAVTAPADVIVEELVVPLGGFVRRGEPLLEMSSSQLTTLRGGLNRQLLLTQKAKRSVEWHREIQERVKEIIANIEKTRVWCQNTLGLRKVLGGVSAFPNIRASHQFWSDG